MTLTRSHFFSSDFIHPAPPPVECDSFFQYLGVWYVDYLSIETVFFLFFFFFLVLVILL